MQTELLSRKKWKTRAELAGAIEYEELHAEAAGAA